MSPYSDMKMQDCLSGSLEIFSILSKAERASIWLHNSIHHRTAFCLSFAFLFLVYFQSSPDKLSGSWQSAESRGDTVQSTRFYPEQIYYSNYIPFPHSEVLARTLQLLAVHICPGLQIGCWKMFFKNYLHPSENEVCLSNCVKICGTESATRLPSFWSQLPEDTLASDPYARMLSKHVLSQRSQAIFI